MKKHTPSLVNLFAPTDLQGLNASIEACTACNIGKPCVDTRNAGSMRSGVIFVGEAPGKSEMESMRPFSGPAGKEFDLMLVSAGFYRDDVYVTNIVRSRPTDGAKNRPPTDSEIQACLPHVLSEIDMLNPRVVVCMGSTACLPLLRQPKHTPMSKVVGSCHTYNGISHLGTYHPSFVMRSKKMGNGRPFVKTVEDFIYAKKLVESDRVVGIKNNVKTTLVIGSRYKGFATSELHVQFLVASGYTKKTLVSGIQIELDGEILNDISVLKNKAEEYFLWSEDRRP